MPSLSRRLLTLSWTLLSISTTQAMDLQEVLRLAEQRDPAFAAVRAARGAAEKTTDIARAALLPQVVVSGGISSNTLNQDKLVLVNNLPAVGGNTSYDTTEWSARLTQPVFNWTAFHQYEASRAQRSRDESRADEQYQQLTLKVAEAYFNVLRAQAAVDLARSREATLNKKLEDAKARLEVGLIPQLDVLEAEAQRDAAQSQRLGSEDQLNTASEALSTLIGQPIGTLARLRDTLPVLPPQPADINAWGRLSVQRNPSLQSARHDLAASESGLTALKGGYLPQVNFFASHSDRSNSGSNSPSVTLNSGLTDVFGLEARWEVFSGGRTRASTRQAELQSEVLRQNLLSAEQQTANQTRSLYMTVRTDVSRLQASRRAVSSAAQTFNAIEAGYEVGTHNIIDLMTAETRLDAARRDYAAIRYDYVIDALRLHATAGIIGEDVIARYNGWLTDEAVSTAESQRSVNR